MRRTVSRSFFLLAATTAFLFHPAFVAAEEEFHCEVLSVTGEVTATDADGARRVLHEGDLLSIGETVQAQEESSADVAFDKEWLNVTHLEEKSKIKIGAIAPALIELKQGGVFAKLKSLPKDSTFEVKTPTAVATVRGTEYRTTFTGGQSQIYNVSPSKVYVYGMNTDGSVNRDEELVLEQSKKTQVVKAGQTPQEPQAMSAEDEHAAESIKQKVEEKIKAAETSGRVSKIQSVRQIETFIQEAAEKKERQKAGSSQVGPNDSENSRVTDLRRRPFKKTDP